jgi:predicted short-subunit dehydrogenase-like oxidoreductase (DUF2520 family)
MKPAETTYHIAILGAGRVGQTLGRLLASAGHRITAVTCRTRVAAEQAVAFIGAGWPVVYASQSLHLEPSWRSVLFITTPDHAIAATAEQLARQPESWSAVTVLHCSGALSSVALQSLTAHGAHVGSMHPLHAFGTPLSQAEALHGVHWCIEGAEGAMGVARRLIADLQGQVSEILPEHKILYHTAAAVAGNLLTGLLSMSFAMLEHCGIAPTPARAMLLRLSEGVLERIKAEGEVVALAGPISRGDVNIVAQHLTKLRDLPPHYLEMYRSLSLELVALAQRKGAPAAALADIQRLLQG